MRSVTGTRLTVPDWLGEVVPEWLAEVIRPKRAPVPWPDMIRAVFAIWVPLAGAEQRAVAQVYHAIADGLRAVGAPRGVTARRDVTAALNTAYDALLTGRSRATGRNRGDMRLMAVLNVSHQMAEAGTALRTEGERPPPWVIDTVDRLADVIAAGHADRAGRLAARRHDGLAGEAAIPYIPPQWSQHPGALALRDSMVALARALSGNWAPPSAPPAPGRSPSG